MSDPLTPTRNQIAKIANNEPELTKALERLFIVAGKNTPESLAALNTLIEDAAYSAGAALNLGQTYQPNNAIYDYIDLRSNAPHAEAERRLCWNDTDATLNIGLEYGVSQQVGLETYARVENNTGVTVENGAVVGFVGVGAGGALSVAPFIANGSQESLHILGVMTHDLPDTGSQGYCTNWGYVRGLNTSGFSVGDLLYPSPTVSGALTNIKPTAPNNVIPIAACLVSDPTKGVIFVRPTIEQMQYYGVFSKSTDAIPAAANTAYALSFDNADITNGVEIGTPSSRVVVPAAGLYQVGAQVQINSGNSSKKDVYLWFRKNGADVPNSTRIVTSDVSNGFVTASLAETVSLATNDYIELVYASTDTNLTIDAVAATAFAPAAPSAILSITQVQQ